MTKAIVYTSKTGNTERYAKILGYELELPVIPLNKSKESLERGAEIIYLGWVMANGIKEYQNAAKRYNIRMVCAVGIGKTGSNETEIREKNKIPASVELFTLQGGFYIQKLHGVNKLLMRMMAFTVEKDLADKTDRTPTEDDLLDLMTNGGSRVSKENLEKPIKWYRSINE